jgi:hypothetical protein
LSAGQPSERLRASSPGGPPIGGTTLTREQWLRALRPILKFAGSFVVIMGLLAIPWPGVQETYSAAFRNVAGWVFGSLGSKAVVLVSPLPIEKSSSVDISMNVGDRTMVEKDGTLPTVNQIFSTRYVAYLPTALLVALVSSTPLPWRRRLGALAGGLILIHLFIGFEILLMILYLFNHTDWLPLFGLGSFGVGILDALWNIFIYQIAARFFGAVMIWILVTFRGGDLQQMLQPALASTKRGKASKGKSSGKPCRR